MYPKAQQSWGTRGVSVAVVVVVNAELTLENSEKLR
jgi:hypothetical protein